MANNQTFGGSLITTAQSILGTFMGLAFCGGCFAIVGVIAICGCLFAWSSGAESLNARSTETAEARSGVVATVAP
jgi:hypothetical protein